MSKKETLLNGYNLEGKPTKQAKPTKRNKPKKQEKQKFLAVAYRIPEEMKDQIKAIAFYQRKDISDLVRNVLGDYIKKHYTQEVKELWENK